MLSEEELAKRRKWQADFRARERAKDPVAFRRRQTGYNENWRKKNREKQSAHNAVYLAVKTGKLARPNHCEGCKLESAVEASHDDYNNKLEVEWLCRSCHAKKDRRVK